MAWHPKLLSYPFQIDLSRRELCVNQQQIKLTAFEYTIIETLIRNAGKVVSKDTLMLQLYPDAELRESHTIDVLMGRLRKNCWQNIRAKSLRLFVVRDIVLTSTRHYAQKNNKPFSLRARFLMATAGVILALSLSYGMVAVVGYIVSFDKSTFRAHRGESNLFFSLAQWHNNKLSISVPPELELNVPSLVLIYDKDGNILWRQRHVPELESHIEKSWLQKAGVL